MRVIDLSFCWTSSSLDGTALSFFTLGRAKAWPLILLAVINYIVWLEYKLQSK
ncbi:MAG: hypothetical protein ACI9IJ_001820 [Psychromonas sp.]|jgi:hypothetical protein